jgi:glyoxylase-like metal-dependent hydrolase (beta-lactamase superfamily II)
MAATLMIGDIRIDGVVDGEGRFDPLKTFRTSTAEMWADHQDLLDVDGLLPFTMGAFLVRTGDTVALVDSGLGDATLMGIVGGRMLDSLAALGVQPADVTDVIYTHLHADHIGWSTVGGAPTFPNATHRCAAAEWQHFMVDTKDVDEVYAGSVNAPRNAFHHLGAVLDRFETFDGDGPLLPGIDTIAAPGHTPGSTVVVVSSGAERMVMLGDAVHCPVQLLESEWGALFDVDPVLARRTRNALAAELEGTGTHVGFSHVPHLTPGRLIRAEGRRRWVV